MIQSIRFLLMSILRLVAESNTAGVKISIRPVEWSDPPRVEIVIENARFKDGKLEICES